MRKRILSLLMAVAMCLSLMPGPVWAVGDDVSDASGQATEMPPDEEMTETVSDAGTDEAKSVIRGEGNTILYGGLEYRIENGQIYCNGSVLDFEEGTPQKIALADNTVYAIVGEREQWIVLDDSLAGEVSLLGNSDNEREIFRFAQTTLGVNTAAACGILANIYAESSFSPTAYVIDTNGLPSYGICQWNGGRYTALQDYCSQNGYDYTTLNGQLHYLEYELKNYYVSVLNSIRNVSNNADGAYSAASTWCVRFEIPANKESVAIVRGNLAKNTYWPEYKDVAGLNGTESYYWPVPSGTETSREYTAGPTGHQAIDITAAGGNIVATKSGVVQRVYTGCGNNDGYAPGGRSCSSSTCSCQNLWSLSGKQFCNWGYGNGVIIKHTDGSGYSMYAHLASVTVSEGQTVRQGSVIGTMGSTGASTGRHLHFQLSKSISTSGTYDEPVDTIDNSKNALAYVYPPYSGSGGGSDSNTISVTWSLNSNRHWVGETNAVVSAIIRFNGTSINNVVEVGVEIYDASHTKVAYKDETPIPSGDHIEMWYDVNSELGYILTPGDYYEAVFSCSVQSGSRGGIFYSEAFPLSGGGHPASKPTSPALIPNAPTISVGNNYAVGDTVTITWDAMENAVSYSYFITEYPTGYAYTDSIKSGRTAETSISFNDLPNGEYNAFVHAHNSEDSASEQSNWVGFTVYQRDYLPTKSVAAGGHLYILYDYEVSWSFARTLCNYFGGHMVTITSAEEAGTVTSLISDGQRDRYWLGATNANDADYQNGNISYRWITDEPFSYSNWASGEPSSSGENGQKEHFAEIVKSWGSQWNDASNTYKVDTGFILEIEPSESYITARGTFGRNSYLVIDKNTTWTDAESYCKLLGGHLVTFNSDAEREFVNSLLQQGNRYWYYLGASKKNGAWTWVDGTPGNYIAWNENEPSWNKTYLMVYKGSQNSVSFDNAYFPESDIRHIGFVCEIDNAVANTSINTVIRNGSTVTAEIICADIGATAFCGTYNNNGQFVTVSSHEISGASTYNFQFNGYQFDYAKVFLLDASQHPLCESKRTS